MLGCIVNCMASDVVYMLGLVFTPPGSSLGVMPSVQSLRDIPIIPQGDSTNPLTLDMPVSNVGVVPDGPASPGMVNAQSIISSLVGIPAIPQKIVQRILAGDYVDIAELCPDSWRMEELLFQQSSGHTDCSATPRPRKKPVTDILTWTECFSTMAAVITTKDPGKAPQLFAYLRTIVRASQTFEGLAWVAYDTQYRRRAAATKSWDWGTTDTSLYNECFTGRARAKALCKLCASESHMDQQCPLATPYFAGNYHAGQTISSNLSRSMQRPVLPRPTPNNESRLVELCGLFNKPTGNECRYTACRFAHICSLCKLGPHPASQCTQPRRPLLGGPIQPRPSPDSRRT